MAVDTAAEPTMSLIDLPGPALSAIWLGLMPPDSLYRLTSQADIDISNRARMALRCTCRAAKELSASLLSGIKLRLGAPSEHEAIVAGATALHGFPEDIRLKSLDLGRDREGKRHANAALHALFTFCQPSLLEWVTMVKLSEFKASGEHARGRCSMLRMLFACSLHVCMHACMLFACLHSWSHALCLLFAWSHDLRMVTCVPFVPPGNARRVAAHTLLLLPPPPPQGLNAKDLSAVVAAVPNLETLALFNCRVSPPALYCLQRAPKLRTLNADMMLLELADDTYPCNADALQLLSTATQLTEVSMSLSQYDEPYEIAELMPPMLSMPLLRKLDLLGMQECLGDMPSFSRLQSLSHLTFLALGQPNYPTCYLDEAELSGVAQLTQVRGGRRDWDPA